MNCCHNHYPIVWSFHFCIVLDVLLFWIYVFAARVSSPFICSRIVTIRMSYHVHININLNKIRPNTFISPLRFAHRHMSSALTVDSDLQIYLWFDQKKISIRSGNPTCVRPIAKAVSSIICNWRALKYFFHFFLRFVLWRKFQCRHRTSDEPYNAFHQIWSWFWWTLFEDVDDIQHYFSPRTLAQKLDAVNHISTHIAVQNMLTAMFKRFFEWKWHCSRRKRSDLLQPFCFRDFLDEFYI